MSLNEVPSWMHTIHPHIQEKAINIFLSYDIHSLTKERMKQVWDKVYERLFMKEYDVHQDVDTPPWFFRLTQRRKSILSEIFISIEKLIHPKRIHPDVQTYVREKIWELLSHVFNSSMKREYQPSWYLDMEREKQADILRLKFMIDHLCLTKMKKTIPHEYVWKFLEFLFVSPS